MRLPCQGTISFLRRYPEAGKACVAVGLLLACNNGGPANELLLAELESQIWGDQMSAKLALISMAVGVVSVTLSGAFGMLGDRLGRRETSLLAGILAFSPTWMLLCFGQGWVGLYAFAGLTVVAGVACITPTGCPIMMALLNDLTPRSARAECFGVCYAVGTLTIITSKLLALVVVAQFPDEARGKVVLLYVVFLQVCYFCVIWWINLPQSSEGTWDNIDRPRGEVEDGEAFISVGGKPAKKPLARTKSALEKAEMQRKKLKKLTRSFSSGRIPVKTPDIFSPFKMAMRDSNIFWLCVAFMLVSVPEVSLWTVMVQFIFGALGIMSGPASAQQEAMVLVAYVGQICLGIMYAVIGAYGAQYGAFKMAKWLTPTCAVCQLVPLLMVFMPQMWCSAISGIGMNFSFLVLMPMQALVGEVASADRVGEANGAIGAAKSLASLVANISCAVLISSGAARYLWAFFPVSAAVGGSAWFCLKKLRVDA